MQAHLKHKSVIIFPDVTDESDPDRDFPVLKKIASGLKGAKILILWSITITQGALAAFASNPKSCTN